MSDTIGSMQDVIDLIIATCEHDLNFRSRGASAIRFLTGYEQALLMNAEVLDRLWRRTAPAKKDATNE